MKHGILVADDEPGVLRFAAPVLERAGFHAIVADSGQEALNLFGQHKAEIDLVVLDVVMPDIDGPGVARQIRETEPSFPVLFISGYSEGRIQGIQEYRFLRKPFTAALLLRTVEEMTSHRAPAAAASSNAAPAGHR